MNLSNIVDVELDASFVRRVGSLFDAYFKAGSEQDIQRLVSDAKGALHLYDRAVKALNEL